MFYELPIIYYAVKERSQFILKRNYKIFDVIMYTLVFCLKNKPKKDVSKIFSVQNILPTSVLFQAFLESYIFET